MTRSSFFFFFFIVKKLSIIMCITYWICDTINTATVTLCNLPLSVCSDLMYSLRSCSADGFTVCLPPAAEGHTERTMTHTEPVYHRCMWATGFVVTYFLGWFHSCRWQSQRGREGTGWSPVAPGQRPSHEHTHSPINRQSPFLVHTPIVQNTEFIQDI